MWAPEGTPRGALMVARLAEKEGWRVIVACGEGVRLGSETGKELAPTTAWMVKALKGGRMVVAFWYRDEGSDKVKPYFARASHVVGRIPLTRVKAILKGQDDGVEA